ncbi:MAG: hypothetical protein WHS38_03360 [Thermodesulforhabdaceae bacterium]
MKKLVSFVMVLAMLLVVASASYAGRGRGAMDGTGPLSITSGCQGPPNATMQPGTGQQMQMRRGPYQGYGPRSR